MTNAIDILTFDAVTASEKGSMMEPKNPDGTGCGFKLMILGKHADVVQNYISSTVNKNVRDAQFAARRGKTPDVPTVEEVRAATLEDALVRVSGWEGVQQEFDKETMRRALRRNPHWLDQILEHSNDLANFSK